VSGKRAVSPERSEGAEILDPVQPIHVDRSLYPLTAHRLPLV
jgi:hypothetical protein